MFSKKRPVEKQKIRIDLIIFGILIYILGILTGIIVGVGISEGEVSFDSFRRFINDDGDVIVNELVDEGERRESEGINVNPVVDINNGGGIVVSGGSSQDGSSSSTSSASVTKLDSESSHRVDNDQPNIVEDRNIDYID